MAGTAPTWRRDARGERPSRRPAGPARLRRSPVCAGSGRGAAHARLGPEPAEAGAPGGVGCESPGAETQAAGSGPPAQRARPPRGLAPAASRLPEAASPPPEPPPALGAGLRAAERAGTGPEPGSGTRMQVRPAARSRGGAAGAPPRGVRLGPARAPRSPRGGRTRRGLARPGRLPPPRPASGAAAAVSLAHLRLSAAASGRSPGRGWNYTASGNASPGGRAPGARRGRWGWGRGRVCGGGAPRVGAAELRPVSSCGSWWGAWAHPPPAARSRGSDPLSFVWSVSVSALPLLRLPPWVRGGQTFRGAELQRAQVWRRPVMGDDGHERLYDMFVWTVAFWRASSIHL